MTRQYEAVNYIDIEAYVEDVYNHFMNRPQKFASAKLLETRLGLALRGLFLGFTKGFRTILFNKQEFRIEQQ